MSQFLRFFKVFCIALIVTQQGLTTADRATPKHGDALLVLVENFYGIQAGTSSTVFFQRNRSQFIATMGRPQAMASTQAMLNPSVVDDNK